MPAPRNSLVEHTLEPRRSSPAKETRRSSPAKETRRSSSAKEPQRSPPAKEPQRSPPAKEPRSSPPAKERQRSPPAKEPRKSQPAKEPRRTSPAKRLVPAKERSRSPAQRAAVLKSLSPRLEPNGRQSRREEYKRGREEEEEEEEAWDWRDSLNAYAWERQSMYQPYYYEDDMQWGHRRGGKGKGRRPFHQPSGGEGGSGGRVYVANLPNDITEGLLMRKFQPYGKVLGLKVIPGRRGMNGTGAIIRYSAPGSADAAIAALKDKIDIRHAKPNPRWDTN